MRKIVERISAWLKKDSNGLLFVFSEFLPCGALLCLWPSGSFRRETLWMCLGESAVAAVVAMVAVMFPQHMLGEETTNWQRIKAVAVELAVICVAYMMLNK